MVAGCRAIGVFALEDARSWFGELGLFAGSFKSSVLQRVGR